MSKFDTFLLNYFFILGDSNSNSEWEVHSLWPTWLNDEKNEVGWHIQYYSWIHIKRDTTKLYEKYL